MEHSLAQVEKTEQKANNSSSGSENENDTFNSEDESRYVGLFVDMVKYYPISIRDQSEDGIRSRLNNLDFVAMNQQILVEKYGIQKDVAYLAPLMWNKAKEHI